MPFAKAICRSTLPPTREHADCAAAAAREIGDARLLQSLQGTQRSAQRVSLFWSRSASPTAKSRLQVEYVFADRNEVQIYYLEKAGDRWKIARVDGTQRIETLIPYGTPVNCCIQIGDDHAI